MFSSLTGRSLLGAKLSGVGLGLAMMAGPALADSISPSTYSASIGVGESVTVHKTVTISAGSPTSAQADIFFLSDTTGSMGSVISSVSTNANTILTNSAGFGNVQWGVGQYKDVGDSFISRIDQTMTSNQAAVTAGIGTWSAGGGGDTPEANFNGLVQAANEGGWRAGSQKFLVWFGDATAHDSPAPPYNTQAEAITALNAQGIKVLAVDTGNLDGTGQATAVATATGGTYSLLGADIAAQIQAFLTTAFATYANVTLDPDAPAGLGFTLTPISFSGSFDRSIDRTFEFDLTFTGLAPGDYTFVTNALVDGGIVAFETDHITVGGAETPLPGTALLMASGLAGFGAYIRRRKKKQAQK